ECSSCEAWYTKSCACSKRRFAGKFVRKTSNSSQRPPQFKFCDEQNSFQDFLNTSKSSNDDSNVVNAPQEPIVFNQNPREDSSQSPSQIDHQCCYGCGDSLNGVFCRRCTCESCGNGAHIGYNFPPKVPVLLLAWDRVFEIKNAVGNKQYKQEDVQELFRKLLNDVQNIHEELAEYINIPSWNCPTFSSYDDDDDENYTIAITPEKPDNSLSMRTGILTLFL
nr:hypothetical protein [Tanacetum cinerariifolium]